jgi:hypothetical protein
MDNFNQQIARQLALFLSGNLTMWSLWESVHTQLTTLPPQQWQEAGDRAVANQPIANQLITAQFIYQRVVEQAAAIDWRQVSPLIWATLWETAIDRKQRRHWGAHYTSEENILKVINALFMDDLRADFERFHDQPSLWRQFQAQLSQLRFLDPACGGGNFLVLAYRELRQLELAVLALAAAAELQSFEPQTWLPLASNPDNAIKSAIDPEKVIVSKEPLLIKVQVKQFYGLDLDPQAVMIAQLALWLTECQLHYQAQQQGFQPLDGEVVPLLPEKSATLMVQDALVANWQAMIAPEQFNYILGNPPFVGYHLQSKSQKSTMRQLLALVPRAGILDYVAGWFYKAAQYMQEHSTTKAALVATSSITQGQQVAVLWTALQALGIKIQFAHQAFVWAANTRTTADVHCVIIGFGRQGGAPKRLFCYDTLNGVARETLVTDISPDLKELAHPLLMARSQPLCAVPTMRYGSKPADGGHLLLSDAERSALIAAEPLAASGIRPFVSAKEFLNHEPRWCLWLVDIPPQLLKQLPLVQARVKQVQQLRQQSRKALTNKLAAQPTLFGEIRQPTRDYLLLPLHFSHQRHYLLLGLFTADWIVGNSCAAVAGATPYHWGILSSAMHMAWINAICGRLKSDVRYSISVVYNNFPWPMVPSEKQQAAVSAASQQILATREEFADTALATLYDPVTMPPALSNAHRALDRAVDRCYRPQPFVDEAARLTFLFQLYEQYNASLFPAPQLPRRRAARVAVKKNG